MYVCDNPENGVVTPLASATVSGGAFLAAPHASSSQAKDLGGGEDYSRLRSGPTVSQRCTSILSSATMFGVK